jgi:hypothetical protein
MHFTLHSRSTWRPSVWARGGRYLLIQVECLRNGPIWTKIDERTSQSSYNGSLFFNSPDTRSPQLSVLSVDFPVHRLTIPISTVFPAVLVQQGLSAADRQWQLTNLVKATDKRYSLAV